MRKPLKIYITAVAGTAAIFLLSLDWTKLIRLEGQDYFGLAVFVLLASLMQHMAVDSGNGHRVRSSIAFLPLLALIVVFPIPAVVVGLTVMWAANEVRPGSSPAILAFNLPQTVLAYGLAALIFSLLAAGAPGLGQNPDFSALVSAFGPFYFAAATFFAVNILLVSGYLAIRDRQSLRALIAETAGKGGGNFVYDLLASPLALLVAYLYLALGIGGLLLVVLPLVLVRHSYLNALQLQRANQDLLQVLIKAIETRDPYTSGHSVRVKTLARTIAEDMGLRRRAVENIARAALLHDIGKIEALYAEIISKDAALTREERDIIQTHATKGADLLQSLTSMESDVIEGVRHHHEHFDGSGYPDSLEGEQIPLAARVIMICDSVDAMLSDRPYRDALPIESVRQELLRCSGTQFDPQIVKVILEYGTLERAEALVDRSGARAPVRAVAG